MPSNANIIKQYNKINLNVLKKGGVYIKYGKIYKKISNPYEKILLNYYKITIAIFLRLITNLLQI